MRIKKYTDFLTEKEEVKEEVKDIKKSPEKRDFEEDDNDVAVMLPTWNTY